MADRSALIVATGTYQDSDLRRLRAPAQDAAALAEVLEAPTIGGFQVQPVIDQPSHQIQYELEHFFDGRSLDDLLLVHFSCHGVKDHAGRLFFAATNTKRRYLGSTAVPATFVNELMDSCRARSIVLLLDCCYSGAFRPGSKGDSGVQLKERLQGHGRAVLTASNEIEYAWEGDRLTGEGQGSVFTNAIVDGLRSGEADRDRDGIVSVRDLYTHVYEQVRASRRGQTPRVWELGVEGDVYVARNPSPPKFEPATLPPGFQEAVEHPIPGVRAGIVGDLESLLRVSNPSLAFAARRALQQLLEDDSRRVAIAASEALKRNPAESPQDRTEPVAGFGATASSEPGAETTERGARGTTRPPSPNRTVLEDLNRALRLEPDQVLALTSRGELYSLQGRYKEALRDLNRALKLEPDRADALTSRGEVYRLQGQYKEALRDLDRALTLEPDRADALTSRGEVYRLQGQYDEALRDLNLALTLEPDRVSLFWSRGEVYRLLDRYEEALKDLDRAVELEPENAWILGTRGQVYFALKRPKEAVGDLERALRLNPNLQWVQNELHRARYAARQSWPPSRGGGAPARRRT